MLDEHIKQNKLQMKEQNKSKASHKQKTIKQI
jgi:hypothetical protein